jgi:hypothetical protein
MAYYWGWCRLKIEYPANKVEQAKQVKNGLKGKNKDNLTMTELKELVLKIAEILGLADN